MYAVYYWPFSSAAQPPAPSKPKVGWFAEWDKKRRIPIEQLRAILKEQSSPWADELTDRIVKELEELPPEEEEAQEEVPKEAPARRTFSGIMPEREPAPIVPPPAMDWSVLTRAVRELEARQQAERDKELRRLQQEDDDAAMEMIFMVLY